MGVESVWACDLDAEGRLEPSSLSRLLDRAQREIRPVMMVVSVAGTTELGMIDPINRVADILESFQRDRGVHVWHHIDAAYGGYFCSTLGSDDCGLPMASQEALRACPRASSITLDPHKLGFVPYACGAFVVPDAAPIGSLPSMRRTWRIRKTRRFPAGLQPWRDPERQPVPARSG